MAKAYRHQRGYCADLTIASYKLLALYCIECGIKALLMEQHVVEHTEELPETARIGHNIAEGLKLLHAPVSLHRLKDIKVMTAHIRPPQQVVSATNLHQALRYGIPVTLMPEITREISNILTWLEGRFNEI
jgi:hypothetical protein